jgi:hypothetical protein
MDIVGIATCFPAKITKSITKIQHCAPKAKLRSPHLHPIEGRATTLIISYKTTQTEVCVP